MLTSYNQDTTVIPKRMHRIEILLHYETAWHAPFHLPWTPQCFTLHEKQKDEGGWRWRFKGSWIISKKIVLLDRWSAQLSTQTNQQTEWSTGWLCHERQMTYSTKLITSELCDITSKLSGVCKPLGNTLTRMTSQCVKWGQSSSNVKDH